MTDGASVVESLPGRPLSLDEAEHLAETGPIHPGSVMGAPGGPLVFTLIVTGDDAVYGLGFDDAAGAWTVVASRPPGEDAHAAVGRELKDWGERAYEDADHVEQEVELEGIDGGDDPANDAGDRGADPAGGTREDDPTGGGRDDDPAGGGRDDDPADRTRNPGGGNP